MNKLKKMIDGFSLQYVMVDSDDVQGLAELHTQFELISSELDKMTDGPTTQWGGLKKAADKSIKLIEEIILQDAQDVEAAMKAVGDTANALQTLVGKTIDGYDISAIDISDIEKISGCSQDGESEQETSVVGGADRQIKLPDNVDEEIFREFISGQPHVLENLESAILAAEKDPSQENRNAIKAILHNMKGESSLMGLTEFATVCHDTETLLVESDHAFPAEKLLMAKDWLQESIALLSGVEPIVGEGGEAFDLSGQATEESNVPVEKLKPIEEECLTIAEGDIPLVTDFINESNEHLESAENDLLGIENDPEDQEAINSIFRAFHTIKGVAGFLNLKQVGALAHSSENLLDLARKGQVVLGGTSIDVIFESIDVMKRMLLSLIEAIEKSEPVNPYPNLDELIERIKTCLSGDSPSPRLGEVLCDQGVSPKIVREALKEQRDSPGKKVGEILLDKNVVSEQQLVQALQKQTEPKTASVQKKKVTTESTVKVTTGRLDSMINMVGELVIAQSMVSQDLAEHFKSNQRLERNASHLDKITRDLQELSMGMRMVPVQGVFQKMARLVRDLSRKNGKDIEFSMHGAETELDRNVVEAIADPLVHMIRNSVDHGVELPDARRASGKNPTGNVILRAYHKGGNIVIEIQDDGKGLDREKILKKAIDNGIVKPDQELSDQEVFRLIFHAGLSTAEKITSVSGRGVGMDVVRKNIENLRGRIDIVSSIGKGTTFSIHLPLTLAVIDGQEVTVGGECYIIPIISIEQNLRPTPEQISTVQGGKGEMMLVRGQLIPLIRVYDVFNIEPEHRDPCESLVVIVTDGENRCCLQVDTLLGQQQVVIKSLGDYMGTIKGVSGGAIMGDGNVSLILDVQGLIALSQEE